MDRVFKYIGWSLPIILLVVLKLWPGFDGLYGQDPYEYNRYALALREFILNGTPPGDYFWPIWYPLSGALLSLIIPNTVFCLQLISALSLSIVFIYSYKIILLIFPSKTINSASLVVLLLITSPFMLRFGLSVMADQFTLATLLMGVYYIFKFIKEGSIKGIYIGAFLFSISLMSRYAVAILILPIAVYAVYSFFRSKQKWYLIPFILLLALLPIIPHLLVRAENSTQFIFHDWVTNWSPLNFFKRSFTTRDGANSYLSPNIIYSFLGMFHPRYFLAGALITLIGFRKFKLPIEAKLMLISISLYLFFLAGIPFQNNRFLLLAFPFFIIFYYPATQYCLQLFGKKSPIIIASAIVVVQLIFFAFSFKKVLERSLLEKEIYQFVNAQQPSSIYTMDIDISLKGRGYPFTIRNIYNEYYQQVDTNALLIFNTEIFPVQWKDKTPMDNWNNFNSRYHLTEIKTFKQGWKAYVFK